MGSVVDDPAGTKVAGNPSSARSSRILGTPTLAPKVPFDSVPERSTLVVSRPTSASKSKVKLTAILASFGHGMFDKSNLHMRAADRDGATFGAIYAERRTGGMACKRFARRWAQDRSNSATGDFMASDIKR